MRLDFTLSDGRPAADLGQIVLVAVPSEGGHDPRGGVISGRVGEDGEHAVTVHLAGYSSLSGRIEKPTPLIHWRLLKSP